MREPFVGRSAELAALDRQFALAAGGQGRAVLLSGPAGIGKTALTRHCVSRWAASAGVVLASGDPDETGMAGGLLSQLTWCHPQAGAELAAVLATGRADALRAGSALLSCLQKLASPRPLVIVVDDAQWGDELSLKSLSFAVRRLTGCPVLCVIAVRAEDVLRLPSGIGRAVAEHGAALDLLGLDAAEAGELAELTGSGALSGRAARRLRDHAGGNPLHIRELLHDLPAELLRTPDATLAAPRSLETLVLSRLAACAPETERLVVAAAVLGPECELADAAALADLDDPLAALQEAIEQRLLTEQASAGPRLCAFAHALIRTAVYRDVGVSRRAGLHRRAASMTSGCTALAHRAAGYRGTDPQLATDLARQAAGEQLAGQQADAAEHLLMAARVAGQRADAGRYLLCAVEMLTDLGDAARAGAYAGEVARLTPSIPRSLLLGRLAMLGGDYAAAERWIAEAWTALGSAGLPGSEPVRESAAMTACQLALMLIGQDRLDDAAAWAQRAADVVPSGVSRACSCAVHAGSLAAAGHVGPARMLLAAELRECADAAGRALLDVAMGAVLLAGDDPAGATRHLDSSFAAEGHASRPMTHLLEAALLRVIAHYRSGDWDQAAAEGERLVTLVDDLDQNWLLGRAHLAAVYTAAGRGNWLAAASHADAAERLLASGRMSVIGLADARVAIAVARDDPAGVVAAVRRSGLDLDLNSLDGLEPSRLAFMAAFAQALARTGRLAEADTVLRWYAERGAACGRRSAMAAAGRASGIIEVTRSGADSALAAFDASLRHLDGLGMPLEEAITRLERGRLLRRLGQRRSAAREIGSARALFSALDARPFIARCNAELTTDATDADAPQPPLTARQLLVAQAAAAGKSNRVIATEMYISIKTVEFHIAQILARLGLDSRTQIATALAAESTAGAGWQRGPAPGQRAPAELLA